MSLEVSRREFLRYTASALICSAAKGVPVRPADVTLRIGRITQEVPPGFVYKTTAYNGSAPAPAIRLRQGVPVTVEIINTSEFDELAHWHGLAVPVAIDGTMEEGSQVVPANRSLRYTLIPEEGGARYLHSHAMSDPPNLDRGTYSGQYAMVYVEPKQDMGSYDQQFFLVTHEWGPSLVSQRGDSLDDDDQANGPLMTIPESTMEVEYDIGSVNGHALGHGEPLQVKDGQRVLFHVSVNPRPSCDDPVGRTRVVDPHSG
jgi:FtsP/CotA-like multicopper oxidase with cupredoxin domain